MEGPSLAKEPPQESKTCPAQPSTEVKCFPQSPLEQQMFHNLDRSKSTFWSLATEGENLDGSLMTLRRRRGAAVSISGALSESDDLQQSEHCLRTTNSFQLRHTGQNMTTLRFEADTKKDTNHPICLVFFGILDNGGSRHTR